MSYSSEVLADSPLAYWRLDEASGATVADSSGNGRTATFAGGSYTRGTAGLLTGDSNTATTFPSTGAAADTGAFPNPTNITIEALIKPTGSWPKEGEILTRDNGSSTRVFQFRREANGKLLFVWWVSGGGPFIHTSTGSVAIGATAHVAVTFDGSSSRIYINGALDSTQAGAGSLISGGSFAARMGGFQDVVTNAWFIGTMDEVAVYPTALSGTRIADHYAAATTAPPASVTGSAAANLPALTAAAAGTHVSNERTGSVAGTLPSLTAAAGGTTALPFVTGSATTSLPALTGSVAGTHTSNDQVGELSSTLPALTAAVAANFTPATVSGAASATLPPLTGSVDGALGVIGSAAATLPALAGSASGSAGTLLGSVHATLPSLAPGIAGSVTTGVIPPAVDDPTVLILDAEGGELDVIGPLDPTPPPFVQRPLMRRSVIVPNLKDVAGVIIDPVTGQPRIPANVYATFPVIEEEVGVPHLLFPGYDGNHDATYYRRNRSQILSDRREEPFGDSVAQVEIPSITSQDDDPDGLTSPHPWTKIRANMEIVLRKSDGSITRVWAGNVFERNVGNQDKRPYLRITALGSLRMAANAVQKPLNRQDPLDLGYLIPRTLNSVVSRRYNAIPHVTTGIMSKKRGSWSDNALGFVQDCLADAWTLSGNQWTIAKIPGTRRAYEMRLKKTAPEWTITNGAMGVSVDLTRDGAVRNVIYGHGVNDDGGIWRNTYYFHGSDPNDGVRLPLAADPRTQKRILVEDESGLMDNPDYDPNIPVYENDVDFGQNSRAIGIRSAEQILDRESTPSLTGRIVLRTDPREGSRVFIPPGDKIKLIGYEGRDVVLHISAVERNWQTYEVTLEVDERSRDALTLAQIRSLQKEARRDPALRPGNPNRRSRLEIDQVVPFDSDSIAGIIQPRSAPGGQWSGQAYPFAGAGRIVKTHFEAGTPFSVAIFAKPISAAHLQSIVGNPLTKDNPFEPHLKVLENTYGMVACWGQKGQRMGYSPGREDNGGAFTGDFDEYNTWEYVSGDGVKLWVFVFPQGSTTFSGRCYPGSEL